MRFVERLPEGWEWAPLSELLSGIEAGKSFKCEERPPQNDEVGVIKVSAVSWGEYQEHESKTCLDAARINPEFFVQPGNFLFSRANTQELVGACVIVKQTKLRVMLSDKILRFNFVDEAMKPWVLAYLRSREGRIQIESLASGNQESMRNIGQERIGRIKVPVPPCSERARIVAKTEELFSELDKGIESLKTAQAQLKVYRQALLKNAFEGKLTAQWRADNPDKLETAEALLKRVQREREQRYQQQVADWEATGKPGSKPKAPKSLAPITTEELAELPELPNGWGHSRLGMLIDEPTYGTSKKCDYETQGIGVLRIPNVASGKIDASDLKFAEFDDDETATYRLADGDLLIIRSNGSVSIVGRCALVSSADINYLYAGYLIRLRPNQQVVRPAYLLSAFATHEVRKQIEQKAKSTSGVNNINTGEIQAIVVAVCSPEEQKQIQMALDAKLSEIDQLEQTLATSLQQSEALRQSILKKAFFGQLVPQDPSEEPASALLARIKAEQSATPKAKKARK